MRWKGRRQSDNIEDRRGDTPAGMGGRRAGSAGLLRLLPLLMRTLGLKGTVLVVAAFGAFTYFSGDGTGSLLGNGTAQGTGGSEAPADSAEQELVEFVAVVLAETEATWQRQFAQQNRRYVQPQLVLYRGATRSACGPRAGGHGSFLLPRGPEDLS
jgi:predicted metalloprotease